MKWVLLYSPEDIIYKSIDPEEFDSLVRATIANADQHLNKTRQESGLQATFLIIAYQQFYVQERVYNEVFATQQKLFVSITGRHNIEAQFTKLTGLSVTNFLRLSKLIWLYTRVNEIDNVRLVYDGYLNREVLNVGIMQTDQTSMYNYVKLLSLVPETAKEKVTEYATKINNLWLQPFERSFLTYFPFIVHSKKFKVVHESLVNYGCNYYIYDYLKVKDSQFTVEFGRRFEKYIRESLEESKLSFKTEGKIKRLLPEFSSLVDYWVEDQSVFIECKAYELDTLSSVNPTVKSLQKAMRTSIFKAYKDQLLPVAEKLAPKSDNYAVILTYKPLFWGHYIKLNQLVNDPKEEPNSEVLPPENVFIIDIYSWNKIIHIIKDDQASLREILERAKNQNANPETRKQMFSLHLDEYEIETLDLSFINDEVKTFKWNN